MADLDALDKKYEEKQLKELCSSLDFMLFVYNHDKKAFARYLYREGATTCIYFEDERCKFSGVANNHPYKERCEHQSFKENLVDLIQNIFDSTRDDAQTLCNHLFSDGYLFDTVCRQYSGGPLSVLFSTPSYRRGVQWNIEKISGNSGAFNIEVMIRTYSANVRVVVT